MASPWLRVLPVVAAIALGATGQTPVAHYEFNGTIAPLVGPQLTPKGPGLSYGLDRFGLPGRALVIAPSTAPVYLDMATNDDTPQRTVSFWFKAAATGANIGMIYESDGPHIANAQTQFGVLNGTMDYVVGSSRASAPIVAGRWYFAAIVRTASENRFYLNCQLVATIANLDNVHSVDHVPWTWSPNARIGNTSENRPSAPPLIYNYNGSIDDFRIYNVALTPEQLATVMGNGTLVPVLTIASHFCDGISISADGSSSCRMPMAEDHYFWAIAVSDANGNVAPGAPAWERWYSGTAGTFTFPPASSGGPNFLTCGRHYKVKLALQNSQVQWVETTSVIYVPCKPKIAIDGPEYVCGPSVTTLTASGANQYRWSPGNQTTTSVDVHPATDCGSNCSAGGTTYTVTGTDAWGCSATASLTIIAAPQNLGLDVSTGVASYVPMPYGQKDPEWKVRGRAGDTSQFQTPFSALPSATVVEPFERIIWVDPVSARWITSDAVGGKAHPLAPPGHNRQTGGLLYWYEHRFFIPPVGYKNLQLAIYGTSADNYAHIYLNRTLPIQGPPDVRVYRSDHMTFQSLYGPFFITAPSSLRIGENVLLAEVMNEFSSAKTPTGFTLLGYVQGQCTVQTVPCPECQ